MSDQIYDHVSEFLAGLNTDDDTAAQVRRAVGDTFGACASASAVDPKGRFRVIEYRVVALFDSEESGSDEEIAGMSLAQLAFEACDGSGMLHTFDTVSVTPVGDDTISALAEEAGSDPSWFLGEAPDDEGQAV